MQVCRQLQQVGIGIDHYRLVPALKEVAAFLVPPVEPLGIALRHVL